jgi:hypothetical protein
MTTPAPAAPAASPAPAAVTPAADDPIKPAAADPATPPAAAPAAPAKPATAIDPAADDPPPATPATFPEDWRKQLSKGEEKVLKRLERYASPVAVAEALINAQDRIAKGIKPGLPADATEEQVKEYRAAVGIPEKPEDYKIELGEGRVIGEDDKPLVDQFLKDMHAVNAPPALVNAFLKSYYDQQDAALEAREDKDVEQATATKQALREEYGPEVKAHMQAIVGMLASAPEGVADTLKGARGPDGTLLLNDPNTVRWLVHTAKALNPAATVAPGSSANAAATVADEMNALKADMANPESDYHTGPKVLRNGIKQTVKQHRYLELVEAQQRLEAAGRKAA